MDDLELYTPAEVDAEIEAACEQVRDAAYLKGVEAGRAMERRERASMLKALSRCNGSTEAVVRFLLDAHGAAEPVLKAEWDESKHPRDHGKFSSAPGGKGGESREPVAPPGPAPRPGLSWQQERGRWVNRETGEEREHHEPHELHEHDFASPEAFGAALAHATTSVPGLSQAGASVRAKASESVASRMPAGALAQMAKSLKRINGHANLDAVGEAWDSKFPDNKLDDDEQLLGFFVAKRREVNLDGGLKPTDDDKDKLGADQNTTRGVYSHELGHAIDCGPGDASRLSFEDEFADAFRDEIADGQLSDYAAGDAQEGFAEFCRLLYGSDVPRETVVKEFPKTSAFFQKHGLM